MLHKFINAHLMRNLLWLILLSIVSAGLYTLNNRHPLQTDLTFNTSNSLEATSIAIIKKLNGPVTVTIYATQQDSNLGDIRKIISEFLTLYQRYKPDLKLIFIDPEKEPEKTRAAGIQLNGEMIIEYAGRNEHLTKINEQIFTSALMRLVHTPNLLIRYMNGHGERRLDGRAYHELGLLFGAKLQQNGFKIEHLNLVEDIPDSTQLLVLTQPQSDLMPAEINKLLHYIDRGGNLLWLLDATPLHGLERLAEALEIQLPTGVVTDPAAKEMNAPESWSLGINYPPHPITNEFNLITTYPSARPLTWNDNSAWQPHALVEVAAQGWVSHKPGAKFDMQHDTRGPVVIALALNRNLNDIDQRIVVVGNAAFLSNSFAGNGGNIDLGINMMNWLAHEDRLITLPAHAMKDRNITLSRMQLTLIKILFLFIFPVILALTGIYIWWRQHRRA